MCTCTGRPIGDYCSKEKLHINWAGNIRKSVTDAPLWANALVEVESGGHRQTHWVDDTENPQFANIYGRFDQKKYPINYEFKIIHIWQQFNKG